MRKGLLINTLLALSLGSVAFSAAAADKFLADRHAALGVKCEACHGPDPKNLQEPTIEQCTVCHPTKALVEKTKDVKPQNPHTSPHYNDQLECTNCHQGHNAGENFCAQCHDFKYQVP